MKDLRLRALDIESRGERRKGMYEELARGFGVTDIKPGDYASAEVDGAFVAVYNIDGEFFAIEDVCEPDHTQPGAAVGSFAHGTGASVAATGSGYSPTAYAVAKAAVLHLSKVAAADLAQFGIRVNAVQPGFINTNIFTASMEMPAEMVDTAKAMIAQMSSQAQPVARGGQPDDIANAVAFLCSDAASFISGVCHGERRQRGRCHHSHSSPARASARAARWPLPNGSPRIWPPSPRSSKLRDVLIRM